VGRFKKLNAVEDKVRYQVEISNRFAALENSDDTNINKAWEAITDNSQMNRHNLNNVRCETSRHLRNKREYPKGHQ
jgi:hypothetical protein